MEISDPVKTVLEVSGFKTLNPVQETALNSGLLEGKSFVVAAPTASGKTVIAEMAALDEIRKGRKVVYIVPLRALASEKYEEFKEKYSKLGIKVAMSIGDMDSSDPWLGKYDIIIVTSEKLDSLLRHGVTWLGSVGLVVVDEIHLLDSPERGPTLEIVITRLRQSSKARVLGLSATISNYQELAEWLGAVAVKSDYRPVKLYKGVCYNKKIVFVPKKEVQLETENPFKEIILKTINAEKQILVFLMTRKSAEAAAEKMGKALKDALISGERAKLEKIASDVLSAVENPTKQCIRLADCLKNGTAFHHAGLTNSQRSIVERAFREGIIKAIFATPTLAAGINLPAFRVLIKDLKRFSSFRGMDYLPVLEIEQMIGRAGRPKYDTEGDGIIFAASLEEAEYAWENYIMGETERIYSKLGVEPVLRMHVLSLIASGTATTKKRLLDFFSKTFYAYQYRELSGIASILEKVLAMLEDFGFIKTGTGENQSPFVRASESSKDIKLAATKTGKRVSELYIDPLTANKLISNIKKAQRPELFHLLQSISNTIEMKPLPGIRKGDIKRINSVLAEEESRLLDPVPNEWEYEYEDFLKSIKNAEILKSWCEEAGESKIYEEYGITPGELRARLERADWLLYALHELALLLGKMELLKDIRKARLRIKHGVKEELLPLVNLKGVGRIRARTLYNAGFKRLADLRKVPVESLERLVGPALARSIKEQLGEDKN